MLFSSSAKEYGFKFIQVAAKQPQGRQEGIWKGRWQLQFLQTRSMSQGHYLNLGKLGKWHQEDSVEMTVLPIWMSGLLSSQAAARYIEQFKTPEYANDARQGNLVWVFWALCIWSSREWLNNQ